MNIIFIILLLGAVFCAFMMGRWDFQRRIIPDVYLFPFLLIGLTIVQFFPWVVSPSDAIIGGLVGYFLPLTMGALWGLRKKNKSDAIGLGDIKLLGAGGIWLGLTGLAIAIVISSVAAAFWGWRKKQKFIPFAPFFFGGVICALIVMKFLI
ncbi:MAG: A24 family peptidase [Rickettsiales bacterium]|jgi:leader peptidase (prepilin peptidase)/N-methyltransferase|nr:A24 family peptidase [Rickettsiales bacterium]